jgi:predicted aspartyl protease
VALRYGDRQTDFFASVDTGASFCVFQRRHAVRVGIAVESGAPMRISTVAGGFLAYTHRVALSVLGIEVEATVYFAEDPAMPRDVLGQTGRLDRMRLVVVDHDRQLYLSHYDDPADGEK